MSFSIKLQEMNLYVCEKYRTEREARESNRTEREALDENVFAKRVDYIYDTNARCERSIPCVYVKLV